MPQLGSYFDELRRGLSLEPAAADDVLRELQTHADDCLQELRQKGQGDEVLEKVLRRHLGRPRVLARLLQEAHTQATWREALLAAMPFMLAAILFATHLWHNPAALAGFGVVVVAVTLGASWHGKPSWFYTWAGIAMAMLVVCGYLAFLILRSHASDVAGGTKNPIILLGVSGAVVYYPLAVLVLCWCTVVVVRRDWVLASVMLSPLPAVTMWLAAVHHAGGIIGPDWSQAAGYDASLGGACLGMALAGATIVRAQSRTARLVTLVSSVLLILAVTSGARGPGSLLAVTGGQGVLVVGFLLIPAAIDGLMAVNPSQIFKQSPRSGGSA